MKNITLPYLSLRSGVVPSLSDTSGAVLYYDVSLGKVMASLGGNDYVVFGEGGGGSGGTLGPDTVGSLELKNGAVENINFRNSLGLSVVGRSVSGTGVVSDIVASADGDVLYRSGSSLIFGKIPIGSVTGLSLDLSGKVVGPASATNNGIVLFDGVSGKLVKNSSVTIDGTGVVFGSRFTGLSAPVSGSDATNKTYVDSLLGLSSSTPSPIGVASPGSGLVGSRFDHVHAHGDQAGGTLHALASGSAAGFMSVSDFNKLNGLVGVTDGDKGDVVVSGSGTAWTIDLLAISTGKIADSAVTTLKINDGAVTNSKIRTSAGLSVVGRSAGTSGVVGDIIAATDGDILRVSGGVLGFGSIPQSSVTGLSTSLSGKVDGLVSATDNVVLRFDGTDGKTIQGSPISISDSGVISGAGVPLVGTDVANKNYVDGVVGTVSDGDKGDVVISGGVWSIDSNVVTDTKLRDSVGVSVIGRSAGTTGDPGDIVAGSDGNVLRRASGALGFGTIPQSSVDNLTTDLAGKVVGIASSTDNVVLRFDGTTGKTIQGSAISISDTGVISGVSTPLIGTDAANKNYVDTAISGGSIPDGDKGDVVVSSSGTVWTIDSGVVSDSKLRTSSGLSVIGRATNTTGSVADIVSTTDGHVLRQSGTSIGFGLIPEGSVSGLSTKLSDGDKGDIVVSGSFGTWTIDSGVVGTSKIADSAVTLAKIENIPSQTLLGRFSLATGVVQNITLGSFLSLNGSGVLSNSSITGDVSIAANSTTSTIGTNVVSDSKFRTSAGLSVVGRSTNTTGNVSDITGTDGQVLRVSGTSLGFGTISFAGIADGSILNSKIRSSSPLSVLGRASNTLGTIADIVGTTDGQVLFINGTTLGFGTIGASSITANSLSLNKLSQVATDTLLGRDTAGTGDVEVITVGNTLLLDGTNTIHRAAISGDITLAAGSNSSTITNSAVTNAKIRNSVGLSVIGRSASTTGVVGDIFTTSGTGHALIEDGGIIGFGQVTSLGIEDNAITNIKLSSISTSTIKGRVSAGSGIVEDLTPSEVKSILNIGDVVDNLTTTSSINMLSATQGKILQDTKQKIISSGTAPPSGGVDGDIYIQYS